MVKPTPTYIYFYLVLLMTTGCLQTSKQPVEISLYNGINSVVMLGDTREKVKQRYSGRIKKYRFVKPGTPFREAWKFPALGVQAVFGNERVMMVIVDLPSEGRIVGKKFDLTESTRREEGSWKMFIEAKLGSARDYKARGTISRALFYGWGDIAYNSLGPFEIALYKSRKVVRYRKKFFGTGVTQASR